MALTPWAAHLYTASGAATALVAALAVYAGDFRQAFLWLAVATLIDATDGVLARALRVKERLPWFDGAKLDDLVDYLTYVFVPVLLIVRAELLPPALSFWLASAMLIASGYGFSCADAKVATTDHFFTGFPSYWNIAAVYLYVNGWPKAINAAALATCVVMVFVPLRYVYPSRTKTWRLATIGLGLSWGVVFMIVIWRLPVVDGPWLLLSWVFPAYYAGLSMWLSARERRQAALPSAS